MRSFDPGLLFFLSIIFGVIFALQAVIYFEDPALYRGTAKFKEGETVELAVSGEKGIVVYVNESIFAEGRRAYYSVSIKPNGKCITKLEGLREFELRKVVVLPASR